jgi:hypothetical protein
LTIKLTRPTAVLVQSPQHCHPERTIVSLAKQLRVEGPCVSISRKPPHAVKIL